MDWVNSLKIVQGLNFQGKEQQLRPGRGVLYAPSGEEAASWCDGSDAKPISLDLSKVSDASAIMVVDQTGRVLKMIPPEDITGKSQLVFEAGAGYFEAVGSLKADFLASEIGNVGSCGSQYVAVFEQCEGSSTLKLRKIPIDEFLNVCGDDFATDCMPYVIGCDGDGNRAVIKPREGYMLGAVLRPTGVCWGLVPIPVVKAVVGSKIIYRFTGSYQKLTIPEGVTSMKIKAWGAFGASDPFGGNPHAAPGGGGGYTEGILAVAQGDQFSVMVGQLFGGVITGFNATYGFGGGTANAPFRTNVAGGGLSGVFTGDAEIAHTESSRAVLIAGGGGAGGTTSAGPVAAGGPGNVGGGQPTMQGFNAAPSPDGTGSGGGGRSGGNAWTGGTGYTAPSVTSPVITPGTTTAGGWENILGYGNPSDADLVAANPQGMGLVVIEFS